MDEERTLETAQAASFLPAVQGQEHLKKKVNKAQFLTINDSKKGQPDKEDDPEPASLNSFRVSENNPHIHKVRDIIKTCIKEGHQGAGLSNRGKSSPYKYVDHAMTEITMKKKDLELVLGIMRDLEGSDSITFEQMFRYKMNEKDEEIRESKKVTKEYVMSALDPAKKIRLNPGVKKQKKAMGRSPDL